MLRKTLFAGRQMNELVAKNKNGYTLPFKSFLQVCLAVTGGSLVALGVMTPQAAKAIAIQGLYNTGVDSLGNALPDNTLDPHYALTSQPSPFSVTASTVSQGYPLSPNGPWVADSANSRWIGTQLDAPVGNYVYQTTFDLPTNTDLSSVLLTGEWATDNQGEIFLNGNSTNNVLGLADFQSLNFFTINSGFQNGINTLDYIVTNSATGGGGPTGLRVANISGNYDVTAVPWETDTLSLIGSTTIFGLGLWAKSKLK